ncbi:HCL403Wp [Eremothecium sinecaudum]|uniref:Large ribosomal subunit protein mL38 n=1 Tax=Eremothecium sinecaudum TaxID=45286 RepID=A0A109UYF1_9SACH|nr:HCL403Wp [Eremothecium sinecaudum]AMD19748.1 HCL403Wp [Eremothecium sinecaudum]
MLRRYFHSNSRAAQRAWADFSKRSRSLEVKNVAVKANILNGNDQQGPPSLKRRFYRVKYNSPEYINEMFSTAYEYLSSIAGRTYAQLETETDPTKRSQLAVEAEIRNPEVQYNFMYNDKLENNPSIIDYEQPVYRHLGREHWHSRDRMLLMQRLETLAAIPDTLPTLDPVAEVNIRFPFSTGVKKWIEPGEVLNSNVTSMEPSIKIQEYDHNLDTEKQLYTILVVNPDEPNLDTDSFKTTLNFGLKNIKIGYNDNLVDPRKYNESNVLAPYTPPVPEKNAGVQRFVVWVFRQVGALSMGRLPTSVNQDFNIRAFAEENNLTAIGAHIWRSTWDANVAAVREKYGMDKGRVFHRVRRP